MISRIELGQLTVDAFLDFFHASLQFGAVKFRAWLFTALNLMPSMATNFSLDNPNCWQSTTNWQQAQRMALLLFFMDPITSSSPLAPRPTPSSSTNRQADCRPVESLITHIPSRECPASILRILGRAHQSTAFQHHATGKRHL